MSAAVTVDDFDTYSNYMHANSVIVLSIGLFTIYLTLFHSTKDMGYYKYYIFNFQLAATLFDLHISFVYAPVPILPAPGICSTSIFSVNAPWYFEYGNYIIMHFTLSYVGVSIFIGLLYRYFALQGNLHFFHSKKGVVIMALCNLIYPIPVTITLINGVASVEESNLYIKTEYPQYYDMFIQNCCYSLSGPLEAIIYVAVAVSQITAVAVCSGVAMYKINNLMKEKKLNFTKKTYDLHRQLIYSLWVQAFLPTCFLAIPSVTGFLTLATSLFDLRTVALTVCPVLCLHSAVLGLSTIVMTKPFRQAAVRIIVRPVTFLCKQKPVQPCVKITLTQRLSSIA
uniref:Serpentine Receptor, class H n=1 Tax=Panagrellus redivivus TaxID=6233 RepID=A0A7E4VRG3_PANRE